MTKKKGVDNGVIAKNVSTDYSGKFFSDDKTREVKYKDNQLVLAEKDTSAETHTHCLCGKTHTAIGRPPDRAGSHFCHGTENGKWQANEGWS